MEKGTIERLIGEDKWADARKAIRAELRRRPNDHWLMNRLSLTYYEEQDYARALEFAKKAYLLEPNCPLVLWDLAGALQATGNHQDAIKKYKAIVALGLEHVAYGPCGEGRAWARGLIADAHIRISESYRELGNERRAMEHFTKHLDERGPGCRSIYPLKEVGEFGGTLTNKRSRPNKAL